MKTLQNYIMKNLAVLNSKHTHNLNLFQTIVFKPEANFGPLHVPLNPERQRRRTGKDVKLRRAEGKKILSLKGSLFPKVK